ncbi:MAG TPA: ferredoxin [Candidatus Nitrosocosmicus sp.]|nr:ferredoxin [Candidatus Nitrosocosmicus sp.]
MNDQQIKDPQNPSGPVTSNNWTVHVDRDMCIGAATCIAVAPKTFVLDSDAKAIILSSIDEEDQETILDAARSCPTAAIIIKNEKDEVVFPK